MTTRTILSLALAAGLGACAAPGAVGPTVSRPVVPYTSAGLERVIGQDAAGLVRVGQEEQELAVGAHQNRRYQLASQPSGPFSSKTERSVR